MPTTAEKLWEAARTLPEPLLAEVLDFAEFLRAKNAVPSQAVEPKSLSALAGGLENSPSFAAEPLIIQRQLRDEWH
jgi:Protein of unknown function (DUF2281)